MFCSRSLPAEVATIATAIFKSPSQSTTTFTTINLHDHHASRPPTIIATTARTPISTITTTNPHDSHHPSPQRLPPLPLPPPLPPGNRSADSPRAGSRETAAEVLSKSGGGVCRPPALGKQLPDVQPPRQVTRAKKTGTRHPGIFFFFFSCCIFFSCF